MACVVSEKEASVRRSVEVRMRVNEQRTPALDEATVVWSVWRSPHPKYLSKAVRRWLAPVRV